MKAEVKFKMNLKYINNYCELQSSREGFSEKTISLLPRCGSDGQAGNVESHVGRGKAWGGLLGTYVSSLRLHAPSVRSTYASVLLPGDRAHRGT